MTVSIIIPIYNEKKNISLLVKKIKLSLNQRKYEIIIIDDSSTDGSKEVLNKLLKKYKKLRVIFRKEKIRDLAKSCRDGFEKALYNKILVMDGDLQHNPKYINKMINVMKKSNSDIVVGARDLVNIRVKSLSLFRQSASIFLIKLLNILFGNKTIDPMSGFFLFKKKIYKQNKKLLFLQGFKILADLMYSSRKLSVSDIIIKFEYRLKGKSKLNYEILYILLKFIFFRFMQNVSGKI